MFTFSRFAIVGALGFVIDAVSFYYFIEIMSLPTSYARTLAFFIAMTFTWLGNRYFTFQQANRLKPLKQFAKHASGACASFVLNFAVFQSLLWIGTPIALAFVLGIAVATLSNYLIAHKAVFV